MNLEKDTEKGGKLNNFLLRNKTTAIIILAILFVGIVLFAVIDSVSKQSREKAFMTIISITQDWEKAKQTNASDLSDVEQTSTTLLTNLAKSTSGLAAAKAYQLIAEIAFSNADWSSAATAYESAYNAGIDTYIAPVCLYNAAVCAEELGDFTKAAKLYKECSALKDFPLAAKAVFSSARVAEQQGSIDEAIDLYRTVSDMYAASDWSNLAKSRVILLQAR